MLASMSSETAVDVAITVVIGYLVGSIPIANLVAARRAKIDLRTVGDRNPGLLERQRDARQAGVDPDLHR